MITRIEVYIKEQLVDAAGDGLLKDIEDLNISGAKSARFVRVTEIEGKLSKRDAEKIGAELLADPVSQEYAVGEAPPELTRGAWVIEVRYKPGVTDPVTESTMKAIRDMGIKGARSARTATKVLLRGRLSKAGVETIATKLLANAVIQTYTIEKK